jgi:CBS domain-containing protein
MRAREIMSDHPACCTPDDTAQRAAQLMADCDCGCLPVVSDVGTNHLVGVVTDRDLATRVIARGRGADVHVREVVSADPSYCGPDDDVQSVERIMADRQVRRVPVMDDGGCCVGMIAQADLARGRAVDERELGRVVEAISERTPGSRAERDVGRHPGQMR